MGCDIHAFLEYANTEVAADKTRHWQSLGHLNLNRDYSMFAALAGVRGEQPKQLIAPRGMPKDAAFVALRENTLFVRDDDKEEEKSCTKEQAEKWVAQRSSEYIDENKKWVTHPDWHSHSWLTTKEFEKALAVERATSRLNGYAGVANDYKAALAAMKSLEKDGYEARIVFWFDN